MRYEIDQKMFAVNFAFPGNHTHGMYSVPLKYNDIQPESINFIELKVTEHHRVPGDYDDVIAYDGYLLKDDAGTVYANQYPRASYGQTTDASNRRFNKLVETREQLKEGAAFEYNLLSDTLASIYDGIDILDQPENPRAFEKRNQLIELRDRILAEFQLQYPQIQIVVAKEPLIEGSTVMHWNVDFYSKAL